MKSKQINSIKEENTMENKKKLEINAAACDVRKVSEEFLSAYDAVTINAACIVTDHAAQVLMGRHAVEINCANTVSLPEDVLFTVVNGPMTVTAVQTLPEEKQYLMVNASLFIEPGSEESLKSYVGMIVNGPVYCPDSMTSLLHSFTINGPVQTYPGGAIFLKKNTTLDRLFPLRAKQDAIYYAAKSIVAVSPEIDFGKLAEKNVRFVTKRVLLAESLAETAVPLFDEKADIKLLPDGCAYIDDDAELDAVLVKRYGGKLYINGDLTIRPEAAEILDQVTYLRIDGDLLVCRSLRDKVLSMDIAYDDLHVTGGTLIMARSDLEISAAMLESAEDGLSVLACADVAIAEDVTPELLREKLVSISACATVRCTPAQRPVIETVSQGVASIVSGKDPGGEGDEPPVEDEDTVQINTAFYTL